MGWVEVKRREHVLGNRRSSTVLLSRLRYGIARLHVPEFERAVPTARSQGLAISTERHGYDILDMPEGGGVPTAGHGPQPDALIRTSRSQGLAVWTEDHATDKGGMPFEDSAGLVSG